MQIYRKRSKKIFKALIESMDEGVIVTDRYGLVSYNNTKVKELLDFASNKIKGKYIYDLFSKRDYSRFCKGLENNKNGKTHMFEVEISENGKKKTILIKQVPIIRTGEYAKNTLVVISDISSRVKSEKRSKNTIKRLRKISIEDGLTGLYNSRHFFERLEQECERSKRYGNHLALLMMDVDYFKKINDSNGHKFGDFVLKEMAMVFKDNCRKSDMAFRYGGDEFSMILPDTYYKGAGDFANKIKRKIGLHDFEKDSKNAAVAISIGISSFNEDHPENPGEFIEFADRALLHSKETRGKFAVCFRDIDERKVDYSGFENSIPALDYEVSGKDAENIGESINTLVKALEKRDPYSRKHSSNVMNYSMMIADDMGFEYEDMESIRRASLLHDIGKIGIRDNILLKNTMLTMHELEQMRKHPEIGVNILENMRVLENTLSDIGHHHEWYNGAGYPDGLIEEEIPLKSRVIAVADAFDAMTSKRPYRTALPFDRVIRELIDGAGKQFSPEIVCSFLKAIKKREIMPEYIKIDDAVKMISDDFDLKACPKIGSGLAGQ